VPEQRLTVARRARLVAQGVAVGLVALLFILLVWALVNDEGGDLAAAANRGDRPQAPEFSLERLDGDGELALSSLAGKAVVLNFWASWCIPCKKEAPFLEEVWRENRKRGLVVLVFDGPGDTLGAWGVTGFPETFVVDRSGRVVQAFVGEVSSDEDKRELRKAIDRALEA
jgi:cytochrome c biogenesis protein CcmG, thiol:disulfide interchange protein DsbE